MTSRARSLLLPAALLALALSGPAEARPGEVVATGHDAITTPGVPVAVRAKFERRLWGYWRPDMRGERVTFSVLALPGGPRPGPPGPPDRTLEARTDADGVAEIRVTPPEVGTFAIEARLARRPDAPAARSRLFVFDPARPVVVTDIDQTLSDLPNWRVPLSGDRAPPFPGAPELLRDLALGYQVIYLTARDDGLERRTRPFLARHGYPDGPVLYNDLGLRTAEERRELRSSHHGEFKLRVLRALQGRGVRLVLGIGNAETDAYAYENAGLRSYILTGVQASGSSWRFRRYADLRARLVDEGLLPNPRGVVQGLGQ